MVYSPRGRKESGTAEQSSVCAWYMSAHFRISEGERVFLGLRV